MLGGFVAALLCIGGWGCSGEPRANGGESVSSTQAADLVPPPGVLAGNSNYWITAANPDAGTGLPITGLNISIAVTQDLHIANGMSIQLNGWSPSDSNVVWQQYGFSVTPPSLGWGIENWPTSAYGARRARRQTGVRTPIQACRFRAADRLRTTTERSGARV